MYLPAFPSWLQTALIVVCAMAAGLIGHVMLDLVLTRLIRREWAPGLAAAIAAAKTPSRLAVLPLSVLAVTPVLGLPAGSEATAGRLLGLCLVGLLGWTFMRMAGAAFDETLRRLAAAGRHDVEGRRRETLLTLSRRLAIMMIAIVTVGLILTSIPTVRSVGVSVFASAGVAGIVIGLAARPTISNLIAGIQIALTQPIRLGDTVIVEGEYGQVEEITSTYVVVGVWDQRRLVLPLSYFLEKPFQNWTRTSPELLQTVYLYLDYAVPVAALRARLDEILHATPLWDRRFWNLQVTNFKERIVEVRALLSVSDSGHGWDLCCHVREQLLAFLHDQHPEALPRFPVELPHGLRPPERHDGGDGRATKGGPSAARPNRHGPPYQA